MGSATRLSYAAGICRYDYVQVDADAVQMTGDCSELRVLCSYPNNASDPLCYSR
jgi:hypothetical protein